MNDRLLILDSKTQKARLILLGAVLLTIAFGWFAVRWQLGSLMAELTHPTEPRAAEIASIAQQLAPADPLATWLSATKEKDAFSPESTERSVRLFEDVVRLSPYDFRWWLELGRAYEQAERPEDAEAAFRRAVELAPAYTYPHWQFGNFYLRHGRSDEAFAELRKTTERSVVYREQVFSLAWDYFDKDPQKLEELAADTPDVHAGLALFYAARGSADNALRIWNGIDEEGKLKHQETARRIARSLFEKQRFREALSFSVQSGIDPEAQYETITNGGFEKHIGSADDGFFAWKIYRGEGRMDILPDQNVKSEGNRSLRIAFKGFNKPQLHNVLQFIAVEPGGRYRLSFMVRTENLRSGGPPVLQVISGKENLGIASSAPFESGSTDWQQMTVDFTVPDDFDGVHIRTARLSCGEDCPLTGTIWYDDFRLTKL